MKQYSMKIVTILFLVKLITPKIMEKKKYSSIENDTIIVQYLL
jgi:hypothetical protein